MKIRHVLLTNDFPPKRGGIQNYHYELWRRLDPDTFTVICPASGDAEKDREFDDKVGFRVVRLKGPLLPTRSLVSLVEEEVAKIGASLVVIEPAFLLGRVGWSLSVPYAVIVFGAEYVIPAAIPTLRTQLRRTIERSTLVIAGGGYPANEVIRSLAGRGLDLSRKVKTIRPGVDHDYFREPTEAERCEARKYFSVDMSRNVVVFVSRLVPRKGADTLIKAVALMEPEIRPLIMLGGTGRDEARLRSLARKLDVEVRFQGGLSKSELRRLYWCGDVFAMLTRSRWLGLEQEGFGIVFLEAAATGLAVLAGKSGGSYEAVLHGESGFLVDPPESASLLEEGLRRLLEDRTLRKTFGERGRRYVIECCDYDHLSTQLREALESAVLS